MSSERPARRMTRGWAITLLVVVVAVFVGGSTLAALTFVTTVNARPLELTCRVVGDYGDPLQPSDDGSRPGYSVETENVEDGEGCDDFYVRDLDVRADIEIGEVYVFTVTNLIGYSTVERVTPAG